MKYITFLLEIAIESKSSVDAGRLAEALDALKAGGEQIDYSQDWESGQTILKCLGELEAEGVVMRLQTEFKLGLNVGAPQVAYRETITKTIEHAYTHKKQTGGSGQFAKVKIRFEPLATGSGFVFENDLVGRTVPEEYIPGVEKGLKLAKESGVIAGFPMIDFKATLIDGQYHDVDSNVMTFDIAARACFREGIPKAGPKLLEPMMEVEVVTPEEYLGDVIGDLHRRRGRVTGMDGVKGQSLVGAVVPLANMFGYQNSLKSMTGERATFTMRFLRYEPVPDWRPDDNSPGAMAMRS